jgi:hypothetical protein
VALRGFQERRDWGLREREREREREGRGRRVKERERDLALKDLIFEISSRLGLRFTGQCEDGEINMCGQAWLYLASTRLPAQRMLLISRAGVPSASAAPSATLQGWVAHVTIERSVVWQPEG